MMKKILAAALALIMVFALTACGGSGGSKAGIDKEAYALYEASAKSMNEADSVSMDFDMTLNMKAAGGGSSADEDIAMTMKGPIKVVGNADDPENLEMSMDVSLDMLGTKLDMTMYYKNGLAYIDTMGSKMRQELSQEEALSGAQTNIQTFTEDDIVSANVENAGSGKKIICVVKGKALSDLTESGLASAASGAGTDMDATFSDATVTLVIDEEGMPTEYTIVLSFEMKIAGESVKTDMTMVMNSIQIGGVTIDVPTDLDSYTTI